MKLINIRGNNMKKEYDFSKGERGKFFKKNAKINLRIYLDPEIFSFIERIANNKNSDISTVVNNLIKTDMKIAEYIK